MTKPEDIKLLVKDRYAEIAERSSSPEPSSCCGTDTSCMADDYSNLAGYVPDADLALGCGLPTVSAQIRSGMRVLDLGSGAGNDAFIAAREVGPDGFVIGVDMTPAMIELAEKNKRKTGTANVEFRLGEIESLPVDDASIDVVLSNCVLNLVPDKRRAFAEISRVLKPGGSFTVSDIVLDGELPAELQSVAALYTGCVAGALQESEYFDIIKQTGFLDIATLKRKVIPIPAIDTALAAHGAEGNAAVGTVSVISVTVRAVKPS